MSEFGAATWRRASMAMLLGTAGFGATVAYDIATHHLPGPMGGEAASFAGGAHAKAAAAGAGAVLGLGRAATENEVAAWDIDVRPDGLGLPAGKGDVTMGEELFAEQCAACHGDFGEGVDRWPVLAGGQGTLASDDPVKTVGSYWPYLSTVYDYVNRAMPFGNAQSLEPDEVYAITAYILYSNDLVDDDFELSHENFTEVRLPNEENFFMDDRAESPLFAAREVCMENCKDEVEITMRAMVLDVTPEGSDGAEASTDAAPVVKAALENEPAETPAAPEPPAIPAIDLELAAAGEKVFRKCKSCHQVGAEAKNRSGPALKAIVDAPIGAVEGFKYSKAFKALAEAGEVWDAASLDSFLTKPKDFAKGTKMRFAGLKKEGDRAAVIEYLKSVAE